jgi:integrase
MPAEKRRRVYGTGSVYETASGVGIRWLEGGKRRHQSPFPNKTAARQWFNENVAPRLRGPARPDPGITLDAFCGVFLERHGATVSPSTKATLTERLKPAREVFGSWTLRELEGAAADVAAWRAGLSETSRYRLTSALRQALCAAVRWRYLTVNPAVDAGRNPQPRAEELDPFTRDEVDKIADELGRAYGPLAIVGAETGLRTAELVALERRDLQDGAVVVQRRYANGRLVDYPKTERSRRRVPLTDRAQTALDGLPARIDTRLVFAASEGGHIDLDNFRYRDWKPACEAAGVRVRGPYHLRHTFATEALAAGVSIFELARLMGTSVAMIDRTYGHYARDTEAGILARLNARSARSGDEVASAPAE